MATRCLGFGFGFFLVVFSLVINASFAAQINNSAAMTIINGRVIGYDAKSREIIYRQCWEVEGVGEGREIVIRSIDGKKETKTISLREADDPCDEEDLSFQEDKAAKELAKFLGGKMLVLLSRYEWPPQKCEIKLNEDNLTIKFTSGAIEAFNRGPKNIGSISLEIDPGWVQSPKAAYYSDQTDIVVVEVCHDPGENYIEGLNVNYTYECVNLQNSSQEPFPGKK